MNKIETVVKALAKVNANNIVCYNTALTSPFFDNVIVASVDSIRQLNAALSYLKDGFAENGFKVKGSAGADTEWVILDGCDILVHVFYAPERERFDIDKLYIDNEIVDISKITE